MNYNLLKYAAAAVMLAALGACNDNKNDITETDEAWRQLNDTYVADLDKRILAGHETEFLKLSAEWAPFQSVYVKWHNDRALTQGNLSPLETSTVNIKYEFENIKGEALGDSYAQTVNGDSIYQSRPNENIMGMWIAMLNMHVGDSVTMVIPYTSGYGSRQVGEIRPFSTLIYHVKMKGIPFYQINK